MKTLLLAAVLTASLAACAHGSGAKVDTVHERIETACATAGVAYKAIAAVNDIKSLKKVQQDQVLKAVDITDKTCKLAPGEDYPYTMSEAALRALEGAAADLNTVKVEVQ